MKKLDYNDILLDMEVPCDAKVDFLTKFYSKESLNLILDKVVAESKIDKKPFSLLLLDLDRFKSFNDKFGHPDGDDMLRYFATTMRLGLDPRESIIIRFGGDEFIVIFLGRKLAEARHLAKSFMGYLRSRPFLIKGGRLFKMTFSGGIAAYPEDAQNADDLVYRADKALYFSKTHGRAKITQYKMMILRKKIVTAVGLSAIALAVLLILHFRPYLSKAAIMKMTAKIRRTDIKFKLGYRPIQIISSDIIYLKSGRVFKGVIVKEDADSVEVELELERGKGNITIRKSAIARMERAR